MFVELSPDSLIKIRVRFTDQDGNVSRNWTRDTHFIEPIDEEISCFPLDEPLDGTALVGELHGDAVYEEGEETTYLELTPNELGKSGQIDYHNCTLPNHIKMEFDFFYDGAADAIYAYLFSNEIPINESGVTEYIDEDIELKADCFIIGLSEFNNELTLRRSTVDSEDEDEEIAFVDYELASGEWHNIKIYFVNGTFCIFLNNEMYLLEYNLDTEFDEQQIHFGVGGRTGGQSAIHRIRNLSVITSTLPAPPDVEDFSLFSWGKKIWAAWEQEKFYKTNVEYSLDEEYLPITEDYIDIREEEI